MCDQYGGTYMETFRDTEWEQLIKFFWFTFIIVGIIFLVLAIVNYYAYRNNPKAVSLSKVIIYLFLGSLIVSVMLFKILI